MTYVRNAAGGIAAVPDGFAVPAGWQQLTPEQAHAEEPRLAGSPAVAAETARKAAEEDAARLEAEARALDATAQAELAAAPAAPAAPLTQEN